MTNSIKNKVIDSLWWKVSERFLSQFMNLFIQIVLARILLPEDFGSLAIINAIIVYCAIFVQSGLSTAIVQKKSIEKDDIPTLLTISLVIAFVLYIILFTLAPKVAEYYELDNLIWPLRIESLILFLGAINSIQTALYQRRMDFKTLFLITLFAVPISGGIGIIMAYQGFGIWSLVAQSIIHYLVIMIYMLFDSTIKFRLGFSLKSAKELYSFSGKILISNLISGMGDTIRTMTIGKNYTTGQLAYYDKAYAYSNLVTQVVTTSMASVLLPTFSRSQDQKESLLRMSRVSVRLISFIMMPILVGIAVSAEPLISLLLSYKWVPCAPFLIIFCFLRLPCCITTIDKQVYFSIGNTMIAMYYEIGLLIFNLIVLLYTVKVNIMAIAIGATLVELLGNVVLCIVSSKVYNYSLKYRLADIWRPILCTCVMAIVGMSIYFLNLNNICTLTIQIVLCVITYYFMSKVFNNEILNYTIDVIKVKLLKQQ
jgi:O-antigen/teichoic acid export membrane protein